MRNATSDENLSWKIFLRVNYKDESSKKKRKSVEIMKFILRVETWRTECVLVEKYECLSTHDVISE